MTAFPSGRATRWGRPTTAPLDTERSTTLYSEANVAELVRAWKDPESRTEELSFHPAGQVDLELSGAGTTTTATVITVTTTSSTGPCTISVTTISTTITTKN